MKLNIDFLGTFEVAGLSEFVELSEFVLAILAVLFLLFFFNSLGFSL